MLVNLELVNQKGPNQSTGLPDVNAPNDCVSAALASGCNALVGTRFGGGDLKDKAYSPAYRGPTDPARYIPVLASLGVHMWEERHASGVALVAAIKGHLAAGRPVYGAEPSQWGRITAAQVAANPSIPTHALMFGDAANGRLTAMNSWPVDGRNAFFQSGSEAYWSSVLCYGHIYPLSRTGAAAPVSTTSTITPTRPAAGSLRYAAHAGIPQIDLDGAQASFALTARKDSYPLLPRSYNGAGDSLVYWSDGLRTRAIKAQGYKVILEDAGPILAAALAHASAPAPVAPAPARTYNVAAIQQHAQGILDLVK